MTTYRFTMPTPEAAKTKGIKLEGLETRVRFWLMGIAFANQQLTGNPLQIQFHIDGFTLVSDDEKLVMAMDQHLFAYGYTYGISWTPA